jgi:hypothetical protein
MGVFGNPYNGSRGWLLHFSADLATEYAPGAFGWDDTAAIVPTSMVPSYTGTSSYLIFTKYNNYAGTCCDFADGTNKIAILDPYATQVESHPSSNGLLVMKEVMTMLGPTPDPDFRPQFPNAVREWCINTAAVDPFTDSVLCPSEDGHLYRWDLSTNSLSQSVSLTPGVSEPYVPTIVGPDGTVFTLNGGTLFAVGKFLSNISLQVSSTSPVFSQPVTLTATVTGTGPAPTQTVSFYDGSTLLGSNDVDSSGQASITISNLAAGPRSITAVYSGDANYIPRTSAATSVTVSPDTTSTGLTSSPNPSSGAPVTFIATVAADSPGIGVPTGTVTFRTAKNVLAVVPLDSAGHASFTTSLLNGGSTTVTAIYNNTDGNYITSSGSTVQQVNKIMTATTLASSLNPSESGSSVTLTATVSSSSTVNAGTVTFKDGRIVLAVVPVDSSGVATFTSSSLSVGSHKIIAIYSGSDTVNGSVSQVVQVVNPAGAAFTSTALLRGGTPNLTAAAIAASSENLDLLAHELRTSTASSIVTESTLGVHPRQTTSHSLLDLRSLEQLFAVL